MAIGIMTITGIARDMIMMAGITAIIHQYAITGTGPEGQNMSGGIVITNGIVLAIIMMDAMKNIATLMNHTSVL
jgi:hypothetical protein